MEIFFIGKMGGFTIPFSFCTGLLEFRRMATRATEWGVRSGFQVGGMGGVEVIMIWHLFVDGTLIFCGVDLGQFDT